MSSSTVVLITGANQGLGYLTALQLSKLPGYTVLVGARNAEKGADAVKRILADSEGGKAQSSVDTILINQDDDASLHAAVKQIEIKFGKLDVLVVSHKSFLLTKYHRANRFIFVHVL
jgi:NAD(P)-dependent dehydrogenase (short-subunit alcohol dehydrogenase family)